MKKTVLTLVSALAIFANSLHAQDMPFGFGLKAGFINAGILGLGEATKPFGDSENSIWKPWLSGGLHGEYAFHENVGVGLEALYVGTGGKFSKKGANDKSYSITIHQISAIPTLRVYPMGREEGEGMLSIHVGPEVSFPIKASGQKENEDAKDIKQGINAFGLGAVAGVGYELPFGLSFEVRGNFGFMDVLKEDDNLKKQELGIAKDKGTKSWYVNASLGYNFANLLM